MATQSGRFNVDSIIDWLSGQTHLFFIFTSSFVATTIIRSEYENTFIPAGGNLGVRTILTLIVYGAFQHALSRRRAGLEKDEKSFPWSDQIVVVTGASGGLGSAIVEQLKSKDCRGIVCVDIATKTKQESDENVLHIQCDISNWSDVCQMSQTISQHFTGAMPTVVISNAGQMIGKPLLELADGQMEQTINVNYMASYYCLRAFLPAMLERGTGHFIATSSVMGYVGVSRLSDYVASKHALVGLMQSLRYELDKVYPKSNIHTTTLVLGQLSTPMFARVRLPTLAKFLMPLQDPNVVAKDIIKHIAHRKSSTIFRPFLARLAPFMPALPSFLRNLAQSISGADEALAPVVDTK